MVPERRKSGLDAEAENAVSENTSTSPASASLRPMRKGGSLHDHRQRPVPRPMARRKT